MRLQEMPDGELLEEYRALRKKTKHDKRAPRILSSGEHENEKKTCLLVKDEVARRGLLGQAAAEYEADESMQTHVEDNVLQMPPRTNVATSDGEPLLEVVGGYASQAAMG